MSFSARSISLSYSTEAQGDAVSILDIDALTIPSVGVTAIIGPSGSGKTSLLSVLAGFITPKIAQDGHVTFKGAPIPATGHAPGEVAFVFQTSMLLPAASGLANALQGVAAAKDGRTSLQSIFQRVTELRLAGRGLELLRKPSSQVSGGEAQRFAILRALLADPQALLCDEPTSSLDTENSRTALCALHHWAHDRGRPVVWVTHNLDQAAHHADHYRFLSAGRLVEPREAERKVLAEDSPDEKHACLKQIADRLHAPSKSDADQRLVPDQSDRPETESGLFAIGRTRYAMWIANALSTAGLQAPQRHARTSFGLLPGAVRLMLSRLGARSPDGTPIETPRLLSRVVSRLFGYSKYGLTLILFVLCLLMVGTSFLGGAALRYSQTKLDDPSVARIVFEHHAQPPPFQAVERTPQALTPGFALDDLRDRIVARLLAQGVAAPEDSVQIRGYRRVAGSSVRFNNVDPDNPEVESWCHGFGPFETVALDADDPLWRQMTLIDDDLPAGAASSPVDGTALIARAAVGNVAVVINHLALERVKEGCALPADEPVFADWAASPEGLLSISSPGFVGTPTLEIVGAFTRAPPLYPNAPWMLVAEEAYQAASQRSNAAPPDPFTYASAYFPIEGFAAARTEIERSGYVVQADSAATVETLIQVRRLALGLPPVIEGMVLTVAAVLVILTVGSVLELNKRVIALFMAHGMRLRDLNLTLAAHLAPALVMAGALTACVIALPLRTMVRDSWPPEYGDLDALLRESFLSGAGQLLLVSACALGIVTAIWWRRTRSNLKDYLQG